MALNTCKNGEWDEEVSIQGSPFTSGGAFDIIMIVRTDGYEVWFMEKINKVKTLSKWINTSYILFAQVIVNGMSFCVFNHRIAVEKVNTLSITYDVFMNNFGIFEVSQFHMLKAENNHYKKKMCLLYIIWL